MTNLNNSTQDKKEETDTDQTYLTIGIVFMIVGFLTLNFAFLIIGAVFFLMSSDANDDAFNFKNWGFGQTSKQEKPADAPKESFTRETLDKVETSKNKDDLEYLDLDTEKA